MARFNSIFTPIITLTALALLALSSPALGDETPPSPALDAILLRPFAFIVAIGGAAGSVGFSPYSATDGAVRSVVRSVRNDAPFWQGTGDFFKEGARGVVRSFSQAAWCPVEYAVTTPLGESGSPCEGIAWSKQGVFAQ